MDSTSADLRPVVSGQATAGQIRISQPPSSPIPMSGFAGDDPFDFEDFSDGAEFCYDPFDCDDGDEREEFCVSGFAFPDSDDGEELCVSGFAFPDGDDSLTVQDHASQASHEEPILGTLGRSFDSDDGLSVFLPQLVSALDLAEDISEEETAGDGGDAEEFIMSGLEREPGLVIEEDADDDVDDGLEFMLSEFDLDQRPVTGGFQTLEDASEGWEEAVGDDDMRFQTLVDEGWEEAAGQDDMDGFDLRLPAFRMLVEDIDSDENDVIDVLVERIEQARSQSLRLPASRAFIEALSEVAPSKEEASSGCAVCKDGITAGHLVVRLPCKHFFHGDCIRPWLAIRNTCPVCRYELPTGDAEYDRLRRTDGGASPAQIGAIAQSGGSGSRATVILQNASECTGGNRLEQNAS